MTTSKARQYYVSEQTHATLTKIGNGNYSRGLRISAAYHERLVEALRKSKKALEAALPYMSDVNGQGPDCTEQFQAISDLAHALTEIEEAGK